MKSKNKYAFHEYLHPVDTKTQTYGCRHTNLTVWRKHCLPAVCAFSRENNSYSVPLTSWANQYRKSKAIQINLSESKNKEQAQGEENEIDFLSFQ